MKEIIKNGSWLFVRILVVIFMSFIVTISISVLATAAFTENIGYKAYVSDKDGKIADEYTYYYSDGDDNKISDYEKQGYTVNKSTFRSELKGAGNVLSNVLSQGISLVILATFIYNKLFTLGNKDFNLVKFKHKSEDKLKGLKIGIVSIIPSIIIFILTVICALGVSKDLPSSVISLSNFYAFQIIRGIIGNATTVGGISILKFILLIPVYAIVPLMAFISYYLGYKDIDIFEKITYKKKK